MEKAITQAQLASMNPINDPFVNIRAGFCSKRYHDSGFLCTKYVGHTGTHLATDGNHEASKFVYAEWPVAYNEMCCAKNPNGSYQCTNLKGHLADHCANDNINAGYNICFDIWPVDGGKALSQVEKAKIENKKHLTGRDCCNVSERLPEGSTINDKNYIIGLCTILKSKGLNHKEHIFTSGWGEQGKLIAKWPNKNYKEIPDVEGISGINKEQPLEKQSFFLEVDYDTAVTLVGLFKYIGGDPRKTRRGLTDNLANKLYKLVGYGDEVKMKVVGTDSLYFTDNYSSPKKAEV